MLNIGSFIWKLEICWFMQWFLANLCLPPLEVRQSQKTIEPSKNTFYTSHSSLSVSFLWIPPHFVVLSKKTQKIKNNKWFRRRQTPKIFGKKQRHPTSIYPAKEPSLHLNIFFLNSQRNFHYKNLTNIDIRSNILFVISYGKEN